ncbi:MAG: amidohydrolase family protein, partial [Chloroflexota bacterium]|nr:amidohydrolase family protein [Chloroflexota bacterium]
GSDWPVALLAAGYEETFQTVTGALDRLSANERAAVLGGNAREFYSLA